MVYNYFTEGNEPTQDKPRSEDDPSLLIEALDKLAKTCGERQSSEESTCKIESEQAIRKLCQYVAEF